MSRKSRPDLTRSGNRDGIDRSVGGRVGEKNYTASDIEVLDGLEAVRRRPHMYVGADPQRALALCIEGAMCLSLEAVALRRADHVRLIVLGDLSVAVEDDGAFPEFLQTHPTLEKPLGEVVLTTLFACRDIKPTELASICDVSITIPNALSRTTTMRVAAEGHWWTMELAEGKVRRPFTREEPAPEGGVRLMFYFDPAFFPGATIGPDTIGHVREYVARQVPCARLEVRERRG
jgi:DNA gyrase subunit B